MRYDVVLLHSMWRFSYSLRMRKNRKTRYGLLSTHDDGLEMRHLDEDEEDATVFDRALAHSRRWPSLPPTLTLTSTRVAAEEHWCVSIEPKMKFVCTFKLSLCESMTDGVASVSHVFRFLSYLPIAFGLLVSLSCLSNCALSNIAISIVYFMRKMEL